MESLCPPFACHCRQDDDDDIKKNDQCWAGSGRTVATRRASGLGDDGSRSGTRRRRKRSLSGGGGLGTSSYRSPMVVLILMLALFSGDDSQRSIATAFPLRKPSSSSSSSSSPFVLSLTVPTTTTTTTTHQALLFPRRMRNGTKHLRKLFSASASAPLDDDDGNETNLSKETTKKKNKSSSESYNWTPQTLALALPALIGMLVDPLLSMMDTAYVGNLGSSIELAALGACTSIFHLAFNAFRATTAATTSLVGNAQTPFEKRNITKISLQFGILSGLVVATFLRILAPWCLSTMGVPATSPLFAPALSYLQTRSVAAPAVLAIMVSEGAFRGNGNTRIPLLASGVAALINLVLDPALMLPPLSRGVQGAAAATAAAQVGALGVYLWFLRKRKMLPQPATEASEPPQKPGHKREVIKAIVGANLAMFCKQGSLLLAWAYATAKATRIGPSHVAAHQVALSCWLVFALLQDGAGVASQVLLTKVLNTNESSNSNNDNDDIDDPKSTPSVVDNNDASARHKRLVSLVKYMLRFSVLQGLVVTGGFLLVSPKLPGWFVPDDPIIAGHLASLLPHVAGQQLLVSLTLVCESLAVGGKQFKVLAIGTALSTLLSVSKIRGSTTVVGVWSTGIVSLFVGRLTTAILGTFLVLRKSRKAAETMTTKAVGDA